MEDLAAKAQLAGVMREFCSHPGYKVLQKFIEGKVSDSRNEWLRASTPADAEAIRLAAKPYAEIEAHLKRLIIEGDMALKKLEHAL